MDGGRQKQLELTSDDRLKILLRIIEKDRRMRSFTDVIGYGLGPTGQKWVTVLFVFEVGIWTQVARGRVTLCV